MKNQKEKVEVKKPTTNKKELLALQAKARAAVKVMEEYREYRKKYNAEHPDGKVSAKTSYIAEIIKLHKQGYTNAEIVAEGYNKNTVNKFVGQYKKRVKNEKTVVSQYIKGKGKDVDEEDEGAEE